MIQTLGCPKNVVDSEKFAAALRDVGLEYVTKAHLADAIVVNTCGFLDDAKVESIQVLLEAGRWKSAKAGRQVFAMGCMTQRDGDEVRQEIPELDGVFGIGEWATMIEALGANPISLSESVFQSSVRAGRQTPGSAYLRISDGCSHTCAFCSIPQMRGLYRSEPIESLLAEARSLAAEGVKELILIGQETTSYGTDLYRERKLIELCSRLSEIEGIQWLRLLYMHPPSTPPELMEQLAQVPKLIPYLDFPIEHASDHILKLMQRKTNTARMKESIQAYRAIKPESCVRTTVLVGFPGETEEDFEQLFRFMEEVKFERAGAFVYSPQEGTPGAELPGRIEEGVALDRLDRIMQLQKQICIAKHKTLLGKQMRVLIESNSQGCSWGRSEWDAPEIDARVRVNGIWSPGAIIPVTIEKVAAYQLNGSSVNET